MATVGYTTTPTYGYFSEGSGIGNQVGCAFTMPSGGLITAISCYAATYANSETPNLCIWDSSGNLLASVAASSTISAGAPAWVSGTLATPLFVANGSTIYIGWSCAVADGFYAEYDNTSNTIHWGEQTSPPGTLGSTVATGSLGAYATYTPSQAYVNTGTPSSPVWTPAAVVVNTGTPSSPAWSAAAIYVNTGTPSSPVWTPAS